jgi:hypothetical protein
MDLSDELERVAEAVRAFTGPGEGLVGIVPTEPTGGERVYVCSFVAPGGARSWLAVDGAGQAIADRRLIRGAVSIAALCELAEESAGGGKLSELRVQLAQLRATENPEGVDEAEQAAAELEQTLGELPRLATPWRLDQIGAAARRLEHALGEAPRSPFAEAMKRATASVDALTLDVESGYKVPLR